MKDRYFIDTNILIYLYSKEQDKQRKIIALLKQNKIFVISTQVIGEFCNVLIRKFNCKKEDIEIAIKDFKKNFELVLITPDTIEKALSINEIYKYSFFDSMVISAALEANCSLLYSEDMQHNQIIENKLTIINPVI